MSSLRSTSVSIMRPPKPPSWRDFVVQGQKGPPYTVSSECPEPAGRNFGARSPISEIGESSKEPSLPPGTRSNKQLRRPRAKIHRTRSEHVIQAEELPKTLASSERFLRRQQQQQQQQQQPPENDGRQYVEENNRRCQTWLESIEACEPLDEVSYNEENIIAEPNSDNLRDSEVFGKEDQSGAQERVNLQSIPITHLGDDVVVEIPEENYAWDSYSNDRECLSGEEERCFWDPSDSFEEKDIKHSGKSRSVPSFSHEDRAVVSPKLVDSLVDKGEFTKTVRDKEDSESSDPKNCNKLCCDFYKTFNSSRRKSVQSETHDIK